MIARKLLKTVFLWGRYCGQGEDMQFKKIKINKSKNRNTTESKTLISKRIYLDSIRYAAMLVSEYKHGKRFFNEAIAPSKSGIVRYAMHCANDNQSEAARLLGISRGTIRRYLLQYYGRVDIGNEAGIYEADIGDYEENLDFIKNLDEL